MIDSIWTPPGPLGARLDGEQCTFRVWAPNAQRVDVRISGHAGDTAMTREGDRGYFVATARGVMSGARYRFVIDGDRSYPDPASRSQPDGVHEPSAVVAHEFDWTDDAWKVPALDELVIYELHVGTFTAAGTFDAVIPQLPRLADTGINAIELLPIAQFPGGRNWGYDGVYPFAAQNSYGGPAALKRLVDAAHQAGIAMILDVVYNHVGPEGNYLSAFGPYFTQMYKTPWGDALNFDDAHSDEVRAFFIQSALQWIDEFHFDGLRFDAVHAIVDASAYPFLAELTDSLGERARSLGRTIHLIAESDLSNPRIITPTSHGGLGFDAQWLDDFHHALHAIVTGETEGYYSDYGDLEQLITTLERGYVHAGAYSRYRRRRHGAPIRDLNPSQFVVCTQNHDQIGNRLAGDRLSTLVSFDTLKLLAAATLLGPYVPMLFMGEEYGEESPFPYFVSHGDEELVDAVRQGRKAEFASFGWEQEPPDPQSETTFQSAILHPERAATGRHRALLALYRDLIAIRRATPLIRRYDALHASADPETRVVQVVRTRDEGSDGTLVLALNFGAAAAQIDTRGARLLVVTDDARYHPDLAGTLDPDTLGRTTVDLTPGNRDTIRGSFAVAPRSAVLLLEENH
jgi:maltooligosyltrehalose trehalohydrolase